MVRRASLLGSAWLAVVLAPGVAFAGMPTPVFTEWATMRFSTISFFLFVLLISALVVKLLWNALAQDFSRLPRLGYFRSLALVVLWGFLFLFVLTMIAGARELMTPEAWQLRGVTYKVVGQGKDKEEVDEPSAASLDVRRQSLERLKLALWDYALKHDGRFPESLDSPELPAGQHHVPGVPRLAYGYVPGQAHAPDGPASLLAFEPDLFGTSRLVLRTDGSTAVVSGSEIRQMLGGEDAP